VNLFEFGQAWKFGFAKNSDLPRSTHKRYTEAQREHLLATSVSVSLPLEPPFRDEPFSILDELVAEKTAGKKKKIVATATATGIPLLRAPRRNADALAEIGVVRMERITGKGRPQTIIRITPSGRERFLDYIDELESVVREVQRSRKRKGSPTRAVPATSTSQ